jgi:hypothetical protein
MIAMDILNIELTVAKPAFILHYNTFEVHQCVNYIVGLLTTPISTAAYLEPCRG